jgi:hypothetical protein
MSDAKPSTPVADSIVSLATEKKTGVLEIMRGPYRGQLFLQQGLLVQAEFLGKTGLSAAYDLLALDEALIHWHPDVTPSGITMNVNVAQILAEMRDAAEPPPAEAPAPAPSPAVSSAPAARMSSPAVLSEGQSVESELLKQYYICLEWTNAAGPVEPFELRLYQQASYLIGRSEDCNLKLTDPSVEPLHASLLVQGDYVELWDLGTERKTAVNGEIREQAVLNPGDVITLGKAELRFSLRLRRSSAAMPSPAPSLSDLPQAGRPSPGPWKGPITAQSILEARQAQGTRALGKVLGKFFDKKKG